MSCSITAKATLVLSLTIVDVSGSEVASQYSGIALVDPAEEAAPFFQRHQEASRPEASGKCQLHKVVIEKFWRES